jgi:hypothetical protein
MDTLEGRSWSRLFDEVKTYDFDKFDVAMAAAKEKELSVVICVGVGWSLPCIHLFSQLKTKCGPSFQVFVLNQEDELVRKFCHQNSITVGSPAIFFWKQGREVIFERARWKEGNFVLGPFTMPQIDFILEAAASFESKAINCSF